MLTLNKDLEREEIEYIFNKFDDNKDGVIDYQEFRKWLAEQS